jgi:hypothetical protein
VQNQIDFKKILEEYNIGKFVGQKGDLEIGKLLIDRIDDIPAITVANDEITGEQAAYYFLNQMEIFLTNKSMERAVFCGYRIKLSFKIVKLES